MRTGNFFVEPLRYNDEADPTDGVAAAGICVAIENGDFSGICFA